jgi:hypothetical protein
MLISVVLVDPRRHQPRGSGGLPMTDAQIQAKATIAAALIASRAIDPGPLASLNKDISNHKLAHLRELTERIYAAVAADSSPE